ncbi:hypothetical protein CsSME_00037708 [Camellia sinensis var. sinensis]
MSSFVIFSFRIFILRSCDSAADGESCHQIFFVLFFIMPVI